MPDEFAELTTGAGKHLESPGLHLPHHHVLLRLWRYPSFKPHISWLVYSPVARYAETDLPIAVKITWDQPLDSARFRDPMKGLEYGLSIEPTTTLQQAELSRAELDSRLASLESIKIPVVIDKSVGLDGEIFGFESFGLTAIRLTWWSVMPNSWKPIVNWAAEMRRFLDAAMGRPD